MRNDVHPHFDRPLLRAFMLCGASALALAGCASVKPWDRDLLAKEAMQLNPHPHILAANEHIYFSKEGSSGGRTFDGGGCGCN